MIPTSQTIIASAESWEGALAWTGLSSARPSRPPSYPAELALDDFIGDYGFAPTQTMLLEYQSRRNLATQVIPKPYSTWLTDQMNQGLASQHGSVRIIFRKDKAPSGWESQATSAAPDGYQEKRASRVSLDICKADIAKALELARGRRLTQSLYRRLAVTHGLVSVHLVQKAGAREAGLTWGEARDQVIAERARQPRSQLRKAAVERARRSRVPRSQR